jgi:NAD(P) transhydrogenase subunit beta
MGAGVLYTLGREGLFTVPLVWFCLALGSGIGIFKAQQINSIQMPRTVALLNGLGGAASALTVGAALFFNSGGLSHFAWLVCLLALCIGALTFTGSMVAALKLQGYVFRKTDFQERIGSFILPAGLVLACLSVAARNPVVLFATLLAFAGYGFLLAFRVGGADMPVIISFLNALSGVAAAVSGIALGNMPAAGVGALVGVAGMILTQIMCKAMNRNLAAVLGMSQRPSIGVHEPQSTGESALMEETDAAKSETDAALDGEHIPALLRNAETVLIVPGYGMALAQAQQAVKELMDALERAGKQVRVAVHPVAGRMPGHMHVLLAEVGVDYDKLYDMNQINPDFAETDLVIAVGACDVMNPAATTAEDTPIYGMPILKVSEARSVIVCNMDAKPGYSGVENTLYRQPNVIALWGNAAETVPTLTHSLEGAPAS